MEEVGIKINVIRDFFSLKNIIANEKDSCFFLNVHPNKIIANTTDSEVAG